MIQSVPPGCVQTLAETRVRAVRFRNAVDGQSKRRNLVQGQISCTNMARWRSRAPRMDFAGEYGKPYGLAVLAKDPVKAAGSTHVNVGKMCSWQDVQPPTIVFT